MIDKIYTEKDFLDACYVIKMYQQQINDVALQASQVVLFDMPIHEFLELQIVKREVRFTNVLKDYSDTFQKTHLKQVERTLFLKLRNAGLGTWHLFCELTKRNPDL